MAPLDPPPPSPIHPYTHTTVPGGGGEGVGPGWPGGCWLGPASSTQPPPPRGERGGPAQGDNQIRPPPDLFARGRSRSRTRAPPQPLLGLHQRLKELGLRPVDCSDVEAGGTPSKYKPSRLKPLMIEQKKSKYNIRPIFCRFINPGTGYCPIRCHHPR